MEVTIPELKVTVNKSRLGKLEGKAFIENTQNTTMWPDNSDNIDITFTNRFRSAGLTEKEALLYSALNVSLQTSVHEVLEYFYELTGEAKNNPHQKKIKDAVAESINSLLNVLILEE